MSHKMIDPNDWVQIPVRDFENNYVSRASYDALKAEWKRAQAKVIFLMTAGDRLLDHVVTQHHPEDVKAWKDAKEM